MPKITLEIGESFQENLLLQLLKNQAKKAREIHEEKGCLNIYLRNDETIKYVFIPITEEVVRASSLKELLNKIEERKTNDINNAQHTD